MALGRRIERRKARNSALKLEHSFLFHISPRAAWIIASSLLCLIAISEFYAPPEFWFGPLYIIVIALAAWALSTRVAVAIGIAILGLKLVAGKFGIYPYGTDLLLPNLGARVLALVVVAGFIGMARKSCEREWLAARTDPLTRALNRQAFFEIMGDSRNGDGWSALIYADLDGLKRLNDEDGHEQGDRSIMAFSETVRKAIRKADVFARMGGDEFVIFMKIRDEDAGHAVAERLHRVINLGDREGAAHLGCSLGVLLLPNGSQSIDAELRVADELMYEAKKSRSGICVATAGRKVGGLVLSPSLPGSGAPARASAIRKADRKNPPPPGPRAAA